METILCLGTNVTKDVIFTDKVLTTEEHKTGHK